MKIERVQVEEGFLDGLDVSFASGLNAIIGERGTGKTSLIELIRFCLGVQSYTSESEKRSRDHALSILGSGKVTVTLSNGSRDMVVIRTANDDSPRASGSYTHPFIFSQTEIETVGLQAKSRVALVDGFRDDQNEMEAREFEASSEVRSLTAEADALRHEIDELSAQVEQIPNLEKLIADLFPQEQRLEKVSVEASEKKNQLDKLSANIAASAVAVDAIKRFQKTASDWQTWLFSFLSPGPVFQSWPKDAGPDPLLKSRERMDRAKDHVNNALEELKCAITDTEASLFSSIDNRQNLEDRARQLRTEVETLQEGAGAIIRQGQQLREHRAQLVSLKTVLAERQMALNSLLKRRGAALDRLDSIREQRFNSRESVATQLTNTLGPRIRVEVARAGQYKAFASAIADSLRGSGLRYNELSSSLAANVSPRELLEAIETNDFDLISEATGITKRRVMRALAHLGESDCGALATVKVEDTVTLQLLDGADYKNVSELSTGQRCTVALPLVLQHTDRVLIVDQPEDHIDNAFIADTLIVAVLARSASSQLIFSTHNANIPVLGNAQRVIQLGSDGRRGFVVLASGLDEPSVVSAITTIMEGGTKAFQRRATFYSQHVTS